MDYVDSIKREGLGRGYSINTIKSYKQCLKKFFQYCDKHPKKVRKKDVKNYLDNLLDKGLSGSTLNVHLSAIKFLFHDVMRKKLLLDMKFSRKPQKIPVVLSKKEVAALIAMIKEKKYKLLVSLMYAAGLRLGETVKLKVRDLDFDRNLGWVREGKGKKDRLFVIARKLKTELRDYTLDLQSHEYIFKGNHNHIAGSSVRKIVKNAAKKACIKKNVHPHVLRHSFATHLVEDNYNIELIQRLLGHQKTDTTMTHIHAAMPRKIYVESPYDTLNLE